MKKIIPMIFSLAALTVCANARVITYTWHQTSSTDPGLVFTAYYRVVEGVPPKATDSLQGDQDFGGLIDLYIQGGDYPAITLASLIPPCYGASDCVVDGVTHSNGYPYWRISVPNVFYLDAWDFPDEPFHLEWEYWATSTSILIGDDNANKRCWNTELCTTTGYWAADVDQAPEPRTIFAFIGGLGLLGVALRRSQ